MKNRRKERLRLQAVRRESPDVRKLAQVVLILAQDDLSPEAATEDQA